MRVSYRPGTYIEYPCLECGYKMRLKTNLNKLSISDVAVIECQDCKIQKEYTAGEVKAIINSKY